MRVCARSRPHRLTAINGCAACASVPAGQHSERARARAGRLLLRYDFLLLLLLPQKPLVELFTALQQAAT